MSIISNMRILFAIRSTQLYFYFEPIITSLLARGHKLKLLFDKETFSTNKDCVRDSLSALPISGSLDVDWAPRDKSRFRKPIYYARDLASFRRYLKIRGQSDFYRARWLKNSLKPFKPFVYVPTLQKLLVSLPVVALIRALDQLLPIEKEIKKTIGDFGPDVVVSAPANFGFSSAEIEYLNAARKMKIPTVVPVMSWDNLTTKGVFTFKPDLLLVWNELQAREARVHHGIDQTKVRIVGAPMFDYLFEKKQDFSKKSLWKKLKREVLLRKIDEKWPIILYLGSSSDVAGDERFLITKLRKSLDNTSDDRLQSAQIIIRPHPLNNSYYRKFRGKNIVVMPNKGFAVTSREKDDYIGVLKMCDCVVGVNTSGMIDAIVLDKPVIGIVLRKYAKTQSQALHFKYLVNSNVLLIVKKIEDFPGEVKNILDGRDIHKSERKQFVKKFIRPRGLKISAGGAVALEIEKLAGNQTAWRSL